MTAIKTVTTGAATRQIIVPTAKKLSYLDAREAVAKLFREKKIGDGRLPSHALHDDILVTLWETLSEKAKREMRGYYPAWAREILVYPEMGGQLKKGIDVVDQVKDNAGRSWIFPASSIPEDAVGRPGVGLFVDPLQENIKADGKRVVIETDPKSVIVLNRFIQNSGNIGLVDELTRVPLESDSGPSDNQKRWLYRIEGAGVRPLVRGWSDVIDDRRGVYANYWRDYGFGVGWVGREAAAPESGVINAMTVEGITITCVTTEQLNQFRELRRNAEAEVSALANVIVPANLAFTRSLLNALRLKE